MKRLSTFLSIAVMFCGIAVFTSCGGGETNTETESTEVETTEDTSMEDATMESESEEAAADSTAHDHSEGDEHPN